MGTQEDNLTMFSQNMTITTELMITDLGDNFTNATTVAPGPSEEQRALDFFHYITGVYIDGFLCLLGMVGNILILVCLQKEKNKTSNTIFLQALAVYDSGLLIAEICLAVLLTLDSYTGLLPFTRSPWFVFLVLPPGWTVQTCCIWIVMIIAIDRYLIVGYPLKSAIWCTASNAKKVVLIMTAVAVVFNIPRWPFYFFVLFEGTEAGSGLFPSHQEAGIAAFDEELYRKIYHTSISLVFLFILPLIIIILLNVRLIYYVKKAMKMRQSMTQGKEGANNSSNQNLTVTLIMVIMISIFVICQMPDFIASLIGAGVFKIDKITYGYYAGSKEILLIINSSINFYIYLIFYKKFRTNLAKICGFKNAGSDDSTRSQATTQVTMTATTKAKTISENTL